MQLKFFSVLYLALKNWALTQWWHFRELMNRAESTNRFTAVPKWILSPPRPLCCHCICGSNKLLMDSWSGTQLLADYWGRRTLGNRGLIELAPERREKVSFRLSPLSRTTWGTQMPQAIAVNFLCDHMGKFAKQIFISFEQNALYHINIFNIIMLYSGFQSLGYQIEYKK